VQLLNLSGIKAALSAAAGPSLQFDPVGGTKTLLIEAQYTDAITGTSVDVYVQTSLDGGASWIDIANFHFTQGSNSSKLVNLSGGTVVSTQYTPTDGSMSANTVKDGIIGDRIRAKYSSAGTYGGAGAAVLVSVSSGHRLKQ
jgi:hypothetical protein